MAGGWWCAVLPDSRQIVRSLVGPLARNRGSSPSASDGTVIANLSPQRRESGTLSWRRTLEPVKKSPWRPPSGGPLVVRLKPDTTSERFLHRIYTKALRHGTGAAYLTPATKSTPTTIIAAPAVRARTAPVGAILPARTNENDAGRDQEAVAAGERRDRSRSLL